MRQPTSLLLLTLLPLVLSAPALGQGVTGSLSPVTVEGLFRGPNRPKVVVAAHRANTGRWFSRTLDSTLQRRRGDPARAENSLPAIDAAIAAGAHVLELDVQPTKDGVLVLMHDSTVNRTTRGRGKLSDMTLAEVRGLRLVPSGSVPTLVEALRHVAGRAVCDLDLKTDRVDLVAQAVQAANAHEFSLVFSGNPDVLERALAIDPRLHVMPRARTVADVHRLLARFRPLVLHIGPKLLVPEVLDALATADTRGWVNVLGPRDAIGLRTYRRPVKRGAEVLQTDNPARVRRCLERWARKLP